MKALKQTVRHYYKYDKSNPVYNFNIVGGLTNSYGVLSGFSTSAYATIIPNFAPSSYPWEIVFKFTTGSNISSEQYVFSSMYGSSGHYSGVYFELESSKIRMEGSTSGGSYNISTGWSSTLSTNTTYWVKGVFSGTDYKMFLSTDGTNYTQHGSTVTNSNPIINSLATRIGVYGNAVESNFRGSVDMRESYIKINNNIWWKGVDYPIIEGTSSDYDFYKDVDIYKCYRGEQQRVYYKVITQVLNEDQTPNKIENVYNFDRRDNFGDSQNTWVWGNHGGVFGYPLGEGFYGYAIRNGQPNGMLSGNVNSVSYTFPTPLPAGTYKFKYASYTGNGATYTNFKLYYTETGGSEVEVSLPTTPTSSWAYTGTFTTTNTLKSIRAYTPTNTYKWGIGPVHLILVSKEVTVISDETDYTYYIDFPPEYYGFNF